MCQPPGGGGSLAVNTGSAPHIPHHVCLSDCHSSVMFSQAQGSLAWVSGVCDIQVMKPGPGH